MERRQLEELTRLDEEENKRIKRTKTVGAFSAQRASPNVQAAQVGAPGSPAANGGRVMRSKNTFAGSVAARVRTAAGY
jgi:hypothetical protein